jgi:hypothetical protein
VSDQPKTKQQTLADVQRAAAEARVKVHNRRVLGRIPMYEKAIGAVRAAAVRGEDVRELGVSVPWPKEFAPLTVEERELCRDEAAKRHVQVEGGELRRAEART